MGVMRGEEMDEIAIIGGQETFSEAKVKDI